jgi:DNA-directed RNA polymerase subunit alpha
LINTTGIIPTDSNFSPVLHVQYNVEQTIISKHNVANDLTLVIATDGSVTPKVVLSLASKILVEHFNSFVELSDNISSIDVISTAAGTGSITPATISTPITDLELSVRSFNCLKRQGIHTVQELTQLSKTQIENIKNLGKKSLREIIKILVDKGYELKK